MGTNNGKGHLHADGEEAVTVDWVGWVCGWWHGDARHKCVVRCQPQCCRAAVRTRFSFRSQSPVASHPAEALTMLHKRVH